jgi:hypothetical protein
VAQIIEEIKRLPKGEQAKVIASARQEAKAQALSPEELGKLAKQMVEDRNAAEADRLQEEIVRGFYGSRPHA